MSPRRWRILGGAVVACGVAYGGMRVERVLRLARDAQAAEDVTRAQADYTRCMVGDDAGMPERRLEAVEMVVAGSTDPSVTSWPGRCRPYLERVHRRLVDSGLFERGVEFGELDEKVRRALANPRPMWPGEDFDVRRVDLLLGDTHGAAEDVPRPPAAHPVVVSVGDWLAFDQSPYTDRDPQAHLRLFYPHACRGFELAPVEGSPFFAVTAKGLESQSAYETALASMDDASRAWFTTKSRSGERGGIYVDDGAQVWPDSPSSTWIFGDGTLAAVVPAGPPGADGILVRRTPDGRVARDAAGPGAVLVGPRLVWTAKASGSTQAFVRTVPATGALPAARVVGSVADGTTDWRSCTDGDHFVLAAAHDEGSPRIGDDAVDTTFVFVFGDANGVAPVVEGHLTRAGRSPRWWQTASLTCRGDGAFVTAIQDGSVRQLACTVAGCNPHASPPFVREPDASRVVATALGGRVFLARIVDAPGPLHARVTTIRMRLAAAESLASAEEVIVFGTAGGNGWDEILRPMAIEVFARPNAALILSRSPDHSILVGVDASGAYAQVKTP